MFTSRFDLARDWAVGYYAEMRFRSRLPLRFSLRTLFAVVTALCCMFAYELNWLRQRREFLLSHCLGHINTDSPEEIHRRWRYGVQYSRDDFHSLGTIRHCPKAPGMLWLFGERGVNTILMNVPEMEMWFDTRENEYYAPNTIPAVATVRRLFPEATLYVSAIPDPPWE